MPIITTSVSAGSTIYTDEYTLYSSLAPHGYTHKTVNHGPGEYARDEDGDGFHEVDCNSIEGVWSLLRSWLRPHRGVSQEMLSFYKALFEYIYNLRCRGKKAVHQLFTLLLQSDRRDYKD